MAKLEMLYDRILVRVIENGNKTRSGLFVPDIALANTPWMRAEVLSVGHGRLTTNGQVIPLQVKEGDIVLFFRNANSGEQLVYADENGEEQLIIREPNVMAILRDLKAGTGLLGLDGQEMTLQ